MIDKVLKDLGLTEREAKIYVELLHIGTQSASVIGRRLGLPRSTAQLSAELLAKKHFVIKTVKNKITQYTAKTPSAIKDILELEKNNYLDQHQKKLGGVDFIVPILGQIETQIVNRPKVTYFEGVDEVKNLFEDVIHANKPVLAILAIQNTCKEIVNYLEKSYVPRRKLQIKEPSRVIVIKKKFSADYMRKNYAKNQFTQLELSSKDLNMEANIQIYGNKVAIYAAKDSKNTHGILIESPQIQTTITAMFNGLWEYAKLKQVCRK